ncbi:SNF2 domain-containing protein CLASSY 3 isoform X2 [Jatropha curcas]|uniref:SNF2 domain-containing protein CLASSY 3 isoform X2 n=1 Tax=Jatropha curcas TaxID=180498 RepID=UPI001892F490|nr:SNF2 domain-containing protein CLASSY 3 isoform X2 [Jatropha curcas]
MRDRSPIARRTRNREDQRIQKLYEEMKKKNTPGFGRSCEKDDVSVNFGSKDDSVETIDLGIYDTVEKSNAGTSSNVDGEVEETGGEVKETGGAVKETGGEVEIDSDGVICISDEVKETDISSNGEDTDDPEYENVEEEKSDTSGDVEGSSSESKEEDTWVPGREIGKKGKGEIDGGGKVNCVAKRTRARGISESNKKRIKPGTIEQPVCVDKEDVEDSNDSGDAAVNCDDSGDDVEIANDETYAPKDGNDDNEHVQELCGGQSTRKRIRAYEDNEVFDILANSIFDKDELPCEEMVEQVIVEPTLPLKFTFGIEESAPVDISEEDKELEKLWAEMGLALCANDGVDDAPVAKDEVDVAPDAELDPAVLCSQGKHFFILDEEIGIKCKFCSLVNLEIRYYTAPFDRRPLQYSERRDYYEEQPNIFDKLCNQDSGHDSQAGCGSCNHMQGTVWNIIPGIGKDLHAHQREGFEFLWKNIGGGIHLDKLKEPGSSDGETGCIISHAPGTGKTRLAIVFLQTYMKFYPKCRPLIIAPCSMLLSWEAEFKKWKVDIPFHNLNQSKYSGKENPAAIKLAKSVHNNLNYIRMVKLYSWKSERSVLGISYKLFEELVGEEKKRSKGKRKHEDDVVRKVLLGLPGLLVLDEGHTARNEQSLIWQALSKVQTEKRIILSGTPFQNNFAELFNILILVRPKFAVRISCNKRRKRRGRMQGARRDWASLTSSIGKVRDDAERLAEVRAIIGPMVHVHRGNILQQRLPGLVDSVVILKPVHLQEILLDKVQKAGGTNFNLEYLVSVVSVHPSLMREQSINIEEPFAWDKLKRHRLNPEFGVKTRFLVELIRLSNAMHEKVLVFSQYLAPLKLIGKQLKYRFKWRKDTEILHMHGRVDTDKRQSLIKNFNNRNSDSKVMLASTKACSEGINLVGASRVVLLDVVWNPSVERQAISRAYRLGQEKVVHIYHLITSGTMEEEKYCRQAEKDRLSELVFHSSGTEHGLKRNLSNMHEAQHDKLLDQMVGQENLKDIFKKIIYQPKESNLVDSFGLANL